MYDKVQRKRVSLLVSSNTCKVKNDFIRGLKDGIPVALGYIPIALACGVATSKAGISPILSQMMSFLIYSGSGQAAVVNLFKGGEKVIFMYALTLFVMNCRYLLLSMSLTQKLNPSMSTIERIIVGTFNTDEVFGVVMREKGYISTKYFLGVATLPYICFSLGNALGSFTTNLLPDSVSSALGIIIHAMFIALIVPPAKESKKVLTVVITALLMSIILECIPVITRYLSSGWIIIICAIVTASVGAIIFPVEEEEGENQ